MRIAVVIGADRADHDADRTFQRGDGRSLAARRSELPVARPVLRRHHVVVDEDDLAFDRTVWRGTERSDAREIDDLAGDAFRAGRATVPKRCNYKLLWEWRLDFG